MSDLDLAGARLTVTWRAMGTHQVLAAYDDRRLWFWALATIGPGSDLVGTFGVEVPEDSWTTIVELAEQVGALAAAAATPAPGELGLWMSSGETRAWLPLADAAAGRIVTRLEPLLGLVRRHPLAAARFTTLVATAPTGQRVVGFAVASFGSEPVSLRLDAESLVLVLDGLAEVLEPPRMGLVAGDGTLLDGLYQPARIEPGANGALSVVLPGLPDGADSVAGPGSLRGWITLVGPWASPPSVPFEATSRSD